MICLLLSLSRLCMATIVFYTCIWVPFLQLNKAFAMTMGFVFFTSPPVESFTQAYLPAARIEDMQRNSSSTRGTDDNVQEMCSICLVEFEREDVVSQLSRCRHVFHFHCIERWLQQYNFTCPLCRSLLFSSVTNTCHSNFDGGTLYFTYPLVLGFFFEWLIWCFLSKGRGSCCKSCKSLFTLYEIHKPFLRKKNTTCSFCRLQTKEKKNRLKILLYNHYKINGTSLAFLSHL